MCLQVEIEIEHQHHAFVDDCARPHVPISVSEFRVGGVKVMLLATDDDAQRRVVPQVFGIDALERLEYLRQLFFDHFVVLALRACLRISGDSCCNGGLENVTSDTPSRKTIMRFGSTFEWRRKTCSCSMVISASSAMPC